MVNDNVINDFAIYNSGISALEDSLILLINTLIN
jgi:hypothetical protein